MNNKISKLILAGALAILAPFTHAELQDLGNGLINDTELGIMWLKDANPAENEDFGLAGIGVDGAMDKSTADAYIAAMNAANYLGFSDWRLPRIQPQNGSFYVDDGNVDGTGDSIYNIGLPGTASEGSEQSELGHLYYGSLGGTGALLTNGDDNPDCCLDDPGPFDNLPLTDVAESYWSGNANSPDEIWTFHTGCGAQCHMSDSSSNYVWPVRAVPAKPVPTTSVWAITLLAGLLSVAGLVVLRLRRPVARSL